MPRHNTRRRRMQKGKRLKRPRSFHRNPDSPGMRQTAHWLFEHQNERKAA